MHMHLNPLKRSSQSKRRKCVVQAKVRGMRIELDEIERVLASEPGVKAAEIKVVKQPTTGELSIIAYATSASLDTHAVLAAARRHLPAHMVPMAIITLGSMPLLQSGKVNPAALPAPDWDAMAAGDDYIPPRFGLSLPAHEPFLGQEDSPARIS